MKRETMGWRLQDCAGVCLAEAMIAMAAGVVVLSATIQTLNHFQQKLWAQHGTIAHHQDLRLGMGVMEAELRLAGPGAPAIGTGLLKADSQEIEFLANLAGLATTLSSAVSPGQEKLPVHDGSDWPKGKQLVVCAEDRCAEGRLARDGRRHALSLTDPLGQGFPAGSSVSVSNQVRFYVRKDQSGMTTLMRQVDGGAGTLIGDVTWFRLLYLDGEGKRTQDPDRVARVRVEVSVGGDRLVLTKEIGLRAR
ncbi:MAG: hypothetical protein ACREIL_02205 [Nitrospiraceae bacterium]